MLIKTFTSLFFLYLVIFPFGQLGRIQISDQIVIHVADLVVGVIAKVFLFGLLSGKLKFPPLSKLFLSFLAVALLSLLINFQTVSLEQFLVGGFYWARLAAYTFFYFAIWNLSQVPGGTWRVKLGGWMETLGIFIVAFGFIQYIFLPDFGLLTQYGWDPHFWRLAGTFLDTGFAGILIVLFTLLNFSRLWPSSAKSYGRGAAGWSSVLFTFFGIVALALTYSRASYLAYIVGLFAIYIVRRNFVWFVVGVLALLVIIPFLPKPGGEGVNLTRTSTVTYRVNSYKQAVEVIKEKPLFGVGYNLYRYTQEGGKSHGASGTDSSLLLILATTGVVGLMLFAHLALEIVKTAWSKRDTVLGLALFASIVAISVHSLFDNSLFYPWVLGWLLILLAVA